MKLNTTPSDVEKLRVRYFGDGVEAKLLAAALLEFNEKGYGGATLSSIAERAGTSKQLAMYHFRSPDGMLIHLTKLWDESARRVTLEYLAGQLTGDPLEKIAAIGDAMFLFMKEHREITRLTPVVFHASSLNSEIEEIHRAAFDLGRERIISLLRMNPRFAKFSALRLKELAVGVHCQMIGGGLFIIATNNWALIDSLQKTTHQSILTMLRSQTVN